MNFHLIVIEFLSHSSHLLANPTKILQMSFPFYFDDDDDDGGGWVMFITMVLIMVMPIIL